MTDTDESADADADDSQNRYENTTEVPVEATDEIDDHDETEPDDAGGESEWVPESQEEAQSWGETPDRDRFTDAVSTVLDEFDDEHDDDLRSDDGMAVVGFHLHAVHMETDDGEATGFPVTNFSVVDPSLHTQRALNVFSQMNEVAVESGFECGIRDALARSGNGGPSLAEMLGGRPDDRGGNSPGGDPFSPW